MQDAVSLYGRKDPGGVRTADAAVAMLAAGANRIGASSLAGFGGLVGPGAPPLHELLVARATA